MSEFLVNECKVTILDGRLIAAPYVDAVMGLFTGSPSLSVDTVLTDLTEQNGTGYARQAMTPWGAASLQPDDKALSNGAVCVFENTGGSSWTSTTGWFFYSPLSDLLISVGTFGTPFVLAPSEQKSIIPQSTLTGDDVA